MPSSGLCRGFFGKRRGARRLEGIPKGGRRDGELKIDWIKPLPRAWPICIDCRLDLWRGSEEAASGQRRGLSGWLAAGRIAYHCVGRQHLTLE
jgi:hypothetical protein